MSQHPQRKTSSYGYGELITRCTLCLIIAICFSSVHCWFTYHCEVAIVFDHLISFYFILFSQVVIFCEQCLSSKEDLLATPQVTELVAREESRVKGHSPRKLWPPENECPPCRDIPNGDSEWDEEAVYYFLLEFYGLKGAELQYRYSKVVTSEKSVVVPYWAAVSIGLASLGCAMATCYSRVHKLKFKYRLA